jgi:hypothetical protein
MRIKTEKKYDLIIDKRKTSVTDLDQLPISNDSRYSLLSTLIDC